MRTTRDKQLARAKKRLQRVEATLTILRQRAAVRKAPAAPGAASTVLAKRASSAAATALVTGTVADVIKAIHRGGGASLEKWAGQ